jgi:hypothetical protein
MQVEFWEIVFETGEYEDQVKVPFERFDSAQKANDRLAELRADLESGGYDKPLPAGWYYDDDDDADDDDNDETDVSYRQWRGFFVDYTGARLYVHGPVSLVVN